MSSLKNTIEGLAAQFAQSIIGALRSASIAEVMEVTSGGARAAISAAASASSGGGGGGGSASAAAPAVKRGPGRPKKAAAAAAPAAAPAKKKASGGGRPGRLGRRSVADIGRVIDDIASLLQKHPGGLRAEQIRSQLGVQAKELPRPLADGLAAGKFTKQGQKRATTYFASGAGKSGGGKSGGAGGRGLPKKRGK